MTKEEIREWIKETLLLDHEIYIDECSWHLSEILECFQSDIQKAGHKNDYLKCLDKLCVYIEANAKNGSVLRSSIAEILKTHFI